MLHAKMLLAQAFPALGNGFAACCCYNRFSLCFSSAPSPQDLLLEWRQHIKHTFPSVRHVTCQFLQEAMAASSSPPLLLDVRAEPEYSCSRIM